MVDERVLTAKTYKAAHDWAMTLRAAAVGMALALAGIAVVALSLKWMQTGDVSHRRNPIGAAISLVCLTVCGSVSILASAMFRYPRIELSNEKLTWRTLFTKESARWTELEPFQREKPPFGVASENEVIFANFSVAGREKIIIELRRFQLSAHALVVELNAYRDHAIANTADVVSGALRADTSVAPPALSE